MSELNEVDLSQPPVEQEPKQAEDEKPEKEEPEKKQPEKEQTLGDVLAAFEGAPDDAQIEKWKETYGEVLCSGFSDSELFVFRGITRSEFVNLQLYVSKSQQEGQPVNGYDVEQKIVETCLLWGSPPGIDSLEKKAGSLSTLHEQVLLQSNFVNAQIAAQYVIKL